MSFIDDRFYNAPNVIGIRKYEGQATKALLAACAEKAPHGLTLAEAQQIAQECCIDFFSFPQLIRRLTADKVLRLDKIRGRSRIHFVEEKHLDLPQHAVEELLGTIAAAAIDHVEARTTGGNIRNGRARIQPAIYKWIGYGLSQEEAFALIDMTLSAEAAAIAREEFGLSQEREASLADINGTGSPAILNRVYEAIAATGHAGMGHSQLGRNLHKIATRAEYTSALDDLMAAGKVVKRVATTPLGGRPGVRYFAAL